MKRRISAWDKAVAETYAVAAVRAGVAAAPGPEKTTTATGRARASIATAAGDPATYEPPVVAAYPVPDDASALHGISNRRPGQSVFVDMGVLYREAVEDKWAYHVVETAHTAGVDAVRTDPRIGDTLRG